MADGWIELFDVETDEAELLFVFDQLITAVVFFHWLRLCFFAIVLLMRSRIFLLGSFLLSQLQDLNINVGLYRKEGLAITNATPRDREHQERNMPHL